MFTIQFLFSFDKEHDVVGFVPKEMFFTKGVGKHREKLTSFELALRSAGIAACNLVRRRPGRLHRRALHSLQPDPAGRMEGRVGAS